MFEGRRAPATILTLRALVLTALCSQACGARPALRPRRPSSCSVYGLRTVLLLGITASLSWTTAAQAELPSSQRTAPSSPPTPGRAGGSAPTGAYVLGGAGATAFIVGTTFGILALEQKAIRDDHCSENQRLCDARGAQANDRGRRYSNIGVLGLGAGALALAGSLWLFNDDEGTTGLQGQVSSNSLQARFISHW